MEIDRERQEAQERIQRANSILLSQYRIHNSTQIQDHEELDDIEENLDFYFNHFLLHRDPPLGSLDGSLSEHFRQYLGDFLVHKAMWTDVESQKAAIKSLLHFYAWASEQKLIPADRIRQLGRLVEREQDTWFAEMERFSEESLETWQSDTDIEPFDELSLYDSFEEAEGLEDGEISLDDIMIPGLDELPVEVEQSISNLSESELENERILKNLVTTNTEKDTDMEDIEELESMHGEDDNEVQR